MSVWLLTWVLVCGTPSDTQLFTQAALAPSLAEGLAHCEAIRAPELASECRAQLVGEQGGQDMELAARACSEAPVAHWRDECRFLLAEVALRELGHEQATALCSEAGAFRAACMKHLWGKLAAVLKRDQDLTAAVELYRRDLDRVGVGDDELLGQAWGVFFGSELPLSGPLRVQDCQGQPEPHGAACRAGLREAVKRHVAQAVQGRGVDAWQPACEAEGVSERAEIVQELAVFRYDPRGLDPFIRQGLGAACKPGSPTP